MNFHLQLINLFVLLLIHTKQFLPVVLNQEKWEFSTLKQQKLLMNSLNLTSHWNLWDMTTLENFLLHAVQMVKFQFIMLPGNIYQLKWCILSFHQSLFMLPLLRESQESLMTNSKNLLLWVNTETTSWSMILIHSLFSIKSW